MRVRISKAGVLEIERAGKYKEMECRRNGRDMPCCDDCALFSEPKMYSDDPNEQTIELDICEKTFSCKVADFEDLR